MSRRDGRCSSWRGPGALGHSALPDATPVDGRGQRRGRGQPRHSRPASAPGPGRRRKDITRINQPAGFSRSFTASRSASSSLQEYVERKARRDPEVTHQKRTRAQYVEPTDTRWNRPCETTKEEARRMLQDVANAYAVRHGNLYVTDSALARALKEWKERPTLPEP